MMKENQDLSAADDNVQNNLNIAEYNLFVSFSHKMTNLPFFLNKKEK